jgi:hypothetical protein
MLSPDDADLCRRDPSLPGLALLLDTESLAEAVRRAAPAVEITGARATYLRYKPGLSCLAAYALDVAGREVLVHAHACTTADWEKYSKLTGPDEVPGPLGAGRLMWPAEGVLISTFPNDRKLKALRRLTDPDGLSRILSHFDPIGDPARATLTVLAYKPERRLVARVETDGQPWAVLRVCTESAYEWALQNARAFRSDGRLRVARPLGHSRWQQVLGTEFLPGQALDSLIGGHEYPGPSIVAPVSEALAELHAQRDVSVRSGDPAKAAGALADLATWVGFVCPSVAELAGALAAELASALAESPAETGATHGDFYASQVLLGADAQGRIGLLDLDEACTGERWADLGNFAAHLESDAIRGHVRAERVGPLVAALNASYSDASARALSPRVKLYTAAALFRLAPHPFRRREPDWPGLTCRIVQRANELLELYRGER